MKNNTKTALYIVGGIIFLIMGIGILLYPLPSADAPLFSFLNLFFAIPFTIILILYSIQCFRLAFSKKYRKECEIEKKDERNISISYRAQSFAFVFMGLGVLAVAGYFLFTERRTESLLLILIVNLGFLTKYIAEFLLKD